MLDALTAFSYVAAACCLGPPPPYPNYGVGPTTYHLHRGSTYQSGCYGDCACALSAAESMRGTLVVRLQNIGNATDFYGIESVNFVVPRFGGQPFNRTITGSGDFLAGQFPFADHQNMQLQLSIAPATPLWSNAPMTFDSEFGSRTIDPPVIDILLQSDPVGCPGVRLHLRASWFRSDWNGDGAVSMQDLFDFLADYFAGNGDYALSGTTSVQDVFAFLDDWFGQE
ncbi:MAG: hypothetical protein IT438_14465 [Phycisphaerales bacterium]|nr:hypothetical protein [Phycisphaerales bacterium]